MIPVADAKINTGPISVRAHSDTATIPLPGLVGAPFRARPAGVNHRHRARKGAPTVAVVIHVSRVATLRKPNYRLITGRSVIEFVGKLLPA